jgi:hypothetical protein
MTLRIKWFALCALGSVLLGNITRGQVLFDGRLVSERWPGAQEQMALSAIYCFASLDGPGHESFGFRTFETDPPGWFRISGPPGNYSLLFTQPAHFIRPVVANNLFLRDGEKLLGLRFSPRLDFYSFHEKSWDPRPAQAYFQTFVAKGTSVTGVGFKLATDGIDGFGPGKQNLLVSIHESGMNTPDQWKQIGPTCLVPDVDCGGAKNYIWSAGWNSGEVPLKPGSTYAVQLRAEKPGNTFQAFWRPYEGAEDCYRVGTNGSGFQHHQLWLAVSADSDGLVIPYNKRVQKQFGTFAGFAGKWSQTYVARGRGLAGAVLYAAVGGAQPPLSRQRVIVRARKGDPAGPVSGLEKVAVGNGNYTGDASWGVIGVAFAPGEVPLEPGATYALEFESIENYETLHGFVNIKKQVSDGRAGFNPYRKYPSDAYENGRSYKEGTEAQSFNLDMQVIEYLGGVSQPVPAANLVVNGDMQSGAVDEDPLPEAAPLRGEAAASGELSHWKAFKLEPSTILAHVADQPGTTNLFARIAGGGKSGKRLDGGFSQKIDQLDRFQTYRLSARTRISHVQDWDHQSWIGWDHTGQDQDPKASTVHWAPLGTFHGVWTSFTSEPLRPEKDSISIWLRARTGSAGEFPFKADFNDVQLRLIPMRP